MMEPFLIDTREQYDLCKLHGIEPLIDGRFPMDVALRVSIQRELFGTGNHEENNIRFYRWVWAHKRHMCEECLKPLPEYSATYVSHIESRGNAPQWAYDPRNTNILCFKCHNRWENGDRMNMRIYRGNLLTKSILLQEYGTNRI